MLSKLQRQKEILKLLNQDNAISPKKLAVLLNVSEMTVRRDIKEMEAQGSITSFYGGISLSGKKNIEVPQQKSLDVYAIEGEQHHAEKLRIARKAFSMIEPRDVIAIDNGTTCAHIPELFTKDTNCLVYTYSMMISKKVSDSAADDIQLFTFGGQYHKKLQMFESREVTEMIKKYKISKFFVGTVGISFEQGLSCVQPYEKEVRRAIMEQSDQVILLADSSKIGKSWFDHFAMLEEVDIMITDSGLTVEQKEAIERSGIELLIV